MYRKDHIQQQKNLSKPILWYRNVCNHMFSDDWETNNPDYKLTTDKLKRETSVN